MRRPYHRAITARALQAIFSPAALATVIAANLRLDSLPGQLGHNEYHYDGNAFAASQAFIEANRAGVRLALATGDAAGARRAFGRLTHTAQDLYAHSNYVRLWLEGFPEAERPAPATIDPLVPAILESPALRSGKLYYPLEALSFIPLLRKWALPRLPPDSHAWMNLDGPERGPLFEYAFAAACARTRCEYGRTAAGLSAQQIALFAS
jgi:hypothetical protein